VDAPTSERAPGPEGMLRDGGLNPKTRKEALSTEQARTSKLPNGETQKAAFLLRKGDFARGYDKLVADYVVKLTSFRISRRANESTTCISRRLAAAADAFDRLVECGVLAIDRIVRIAEVFLVRHLIGTRLAVSDRRLQWAPLPPLPRRCPVGLVASLRDRRRAGHQGQQCDRHQQFSHLASPITEKCIPSDHPSIMSSQQS
jgi:hypothetical protein